MALRWYVVHAFSQYEKKVAVALKERIERFAMQDRFGEIIVPTEEVIEMKGGQKRKSERKNIQNIGAGTRCLSCGALHFCWTPKCGVCGDAMHFNLGSHSRGGR